MVPIMPVGFRYEVNLSGAGMQDSRRRRYPSPTILFLLDQDEPYHLAYVRALEEAGMIVLPVMDSDKIFRLTAELHPDALVACFEPKTRDRTLEFSRSLKRDSQTQLLPVVLVSRSIDADALREAAKTGVLALAVRAPDGRKLQGAIQGIIAVAHRQTERRRSMI